ncbi:MAG: type II toxin-antitoxin system VapC family toxin [Longispora sp.]|nr:type II toxin-antitoxin system VapC family toxin [Longispora sp. (in: high G+C Gram-positive bacteria)]
MNEYVVDASAALGALGREDAVGIALRQRIGNAICHAPHLIDAEVGHVLRRGERLREISADTALTALRALAGLIDHRYPHAGQLADRAWHTRHNITFYDGLYVALATVLNLTLLTADARLSKAPGLTCSIELIS